MATTKHEFDGVDQVVLIAASRLISIAFSLILLYLLEQQRASQRCPMSR